LLGETDHTFLYDICKNYIIYIMSLYSGTIIAEALPNLSVATARQRFDELHSHRSDRRVFSNGIERVGRIEPAVLGRELLGLMFRNRRNTNEYGQFNDNDPVIQGSYELFSHPHIRHLIGRFREISQNITEESGLVSNKHSRLLVTASHDGKPAIPWHIDVPETPTVRWCTSVSLTGAQATRGAVGFYLASEVSKLDELVEAPGSTFTVQNYFKPGDIVRFGPGDVHASPSEPMPRVHLQWSSY
jgi:hypothetical protein